jgi:hypothetical protein
MWQTIAEFSKERIENLYSKDSFEPMKRLIAILQKKVYAESVFVFTSLYDFCITLQPEYSAETKDKIVINFDKEKDLFTAGYYDVKTKLGITYCCTEKQIESLIDAFVLRMFLTENNEKLEVEVEEMPSFQIGQKVETVLDEYSHNYHRGTVFDIVKHHQQNRFIYFIKENGKNLKRRYFKENLRQI